MSEKDYPEILKEYAKRHKEQNLGRGEPSVFELHLTKPPITTRIVTQDLVRDLTFTEGKGKYVALFDPKYIENLKKHAKVLSKEEIEDGITKKFEKIVALQDASAMRKAQMNELDKTRKKNEKLTDLEEAAKEKSEYLRKKSKTQRQENEEEIKAFNASITAAKVQAIRDLQKQEKIVIKEKHKKADLELDEMMEDLRLKGVENDIKKEEGKRAAVKEAAKFLREQIYHNYEASLLEEEKKKREGEKMVKKFEQMRFEDQKNMIDEKKRRQKMMVDLTKTNNELKELKEFKKKVSLEEDKIIAAYQADKKAQEEYAENEKKRQQRKREMQIAKIREKQEKAQDVKAEKDALRARRAQEQKEREYRKKETEAILKQKQFREDMMKNRMEQQRLKSTMIRLEMEKEDEENKAEKKMQNELMETEIKLFQKRKENNLKHGKDVWNQILEKEMEKIQERKDFFEDGQYLNYEIRNRHFRIKELQNKKLEELEKYDIPEIYMAHIRRKFGLIKE